eukprot:783900-Lingulodinium_polyedra.AAC.1
MVPPPAFFVALMGKARVVCTRGKAAGPDGVVVEALELLPPEAMQAIDAMVWWCVAKGALTRPQ